MRQAAILAVLAVLAAAPASSSTGIAAAPATRPTGDTVAAAIAGDVQGAHDPVLIEADRRWYVYSTGRHDRNPIAMRTSPDLVHWTAGPSPLARIPAWALVAVPGAKEIWAPDISRAGGRYRLYYAVSTFGSQRSVIGLATSASLDPAAPDYGWRDEGSVVASTPGIGWNAIDPNFARDRAGGEWLAFGSYWGGIELVRLDPATGKPPPGKLATINIARREAGKDAIEGSFIVDHGGWYWLIASFDHCCRGAASDYYTVVGRAKAITGPYADRDGRLMLDGGGTVLARAGVGDRYRATGHAGFFHAADGRDFLVYHAYDAQQRGAATLRLSRVRWDAAGWPTLSPGLAEP